MPHRYGVAVDLVVLTIQRDRLAVLCVRRGIPPYRGQWALPGGFVLPDEDLDAAAERELAEETGIRGTGHLEQLGTYGQPGRDPRGRVVSIAYLALIPDQPVPVASSDASHAEWRPVAGGSAPVETPTIKSRSAGTPGPGSLTTEALAGAALGEAAAGAPLGGAAGAPAQAVTGAPAGTPVGGAASQAPDGGTGPRVLATGAPAGGAASRTPATGALAGEGVARAALGGAPAGGVAGKPAGAVEGGALVEGTIAGGGGGALAGGGVPGGSGVPPMLAFDHDRILADGVERARAKLEYTPLAAAFCPPEFTIAELRAVYEVVWGTRLDPRNFHRKATSTVGFVEPTGRATDGQRGRPAQLYRRGTAPVLYPPLLRS